MVIRLCDWEALTIGHQTADFGRVGHCGRGDKTFLICHVISKKCVFKGLD